jgi:hypothetical protein
VVCWRKQEATVFGWPEKEKPNRGQPEIATQTSNSVGRFSRYGIVSGWLEISLALSHKKLSVRNIK